MRIHTHCDELFMSVGREFCCRNGPYVFTSFVFVTGWKFSKLFRPIPHDFYISSSRIQQVASDVYIWKQSCFVHCIGSLYVCAVLCERMFWFCGYVSGIKHSESELSLESCYGQKTFQYSVFMYVYSVCTSNFHSRYRFNVKYWILIFHAMWIYRDC
jgi:hypothetical protein